VQVKLAASCVRYGGFTPRMVDIPAERGYRARM
jgi:hypothetical protein